MPDESPIRRSDSNALSRRAALAQTVIIAAVVFLFSIAIIGFNAYRLHSQLEANITGVANLARTGLASAVWQVDQASAQDFINATLQDPTTAYAEVVTGREVMASKVRPQFASLTFEAFQTDTRFRTRSVEIRKYGELIGTFNLAVSTEKFWRDIFINAASSLTLAVVLILAISQTTLFFSRKRLFVPLKQLEEASMDIADGDLDAPIDTSLPGELGNLARAIDDMRMSMTTLITDLKNANTRLEEHKGSLKNTVRERTEELKRKNESLNQALEDVQSAKQVAEVANLAKSRFLASMSHEIRTPMNAILGMADILSETELSDDQAKYVEVFRTAGEGLLEILDDILDLSKIEAGRLSLVNQDFKLSTVIDKTLSLLQGKATAKGLEIAVSIAPAVPQRLTGDPTRLKQILINLIGNAIKFTETGTIALSVEPAPSENGTTLQFSVSDTGIGIPPGKLGTIFDTFTQADDSNTRKYGGTGLGLAICKQLVRMMGGRIRVESTLGAGSTFHFTANFNTGRPNANTPIEINDPDAKDIPPLRILMLEDSKYNAFVIQTYLKNTPCYLTTMEDGVSGLAEFKRGGYDCVLMDVQMPGMDGLEATRAIRDWEATHAISRTPIITMTAHSMAGDAELCLKAGADHYLSKPVKKTTLLQLLKEYQPGSPPDEPGPTMELKQLVIDAHAAMRNQNPDAVRTAGMALMEQGMELGKDTISGYGKELIQAAEDGGDPERVRQILAVLTDYMERTEELR